MKKNITILLFLFLSYYSWSNEPVKLTIDCSVLRYLTLKEYCEFTKTSYDTLKYVNEIYFSSYYSDSLPISVNDFPNIESISFWNGWAYPNYGLFGIKGISTFKKLKKLYLDFNTGGNFPTQHFAVFSNISEIYKCYNLEELTINTRYPIIISKDIIKLKKLKNLSCKITNPEVLINSDIWKNWDNKSSYQDNFSDILLLCKLQKKTSKFYNDYFFIPRREVGILWPKYKYDFLIDSVFTIYYENNKIACKGHYSKKFTRIGTWLYYNENGGLRKKIIYDKSGNLIEYSVYYDDLRTESTIFSTKNDGYYCFENSYIEKQNHDKYRTLYKYDTVNKIIYAIFSNDHIVIYDFKNGLIYRDIKYKNSQLLSFSCCKVMDGLPNYIWYDIQDDPVKSYIMKNNGKNPFSCQRRDQQYIRGHQDNDMITAKLFVEQSFYEFDKLYKSF